MTLKDLRTLEIGLELYKRDKPLDGQCDELIGFLLRVVRQDIMRLEEKAARRRMKAKLRQVTSANP